MNGDVLAFDESLSYHYKGKILFKYNLCKKGKLLVCSCVPVCFFFNVNSSVKFFFLCCVGVYVLQITPDNNDPGATKKSHLISFTTIGITFQTTASSNVLNIMPVVGNSSLAGKFSNFDQIFKVFIHT